MTPGVKGRRLAVSVAILIAILFACVLLLGRGAGQWLVREDPLSRADVVVVLSGGMPYRAEEAAKIFAMGYAPQVWISRPEKPAALGRLGVHFVGEEEYDREVLMHLGVPEAAIHILPDPILNTEQEVEEIASEIQRNGKSTAIIVTSPPHTRRVRTLWNKLVGDHSHVVVRAAFEDPFDARHWWLSTQDTLAVVREMLGLMNAWTGLHVRPHAN